MYECMYVYNTMIPMARLWQWQTSTKDTFIASFEVPSVAFEELSGTFSSNLSTFVVTFDLSLVALSSNVCFFVFS